MYIISIIKLQKTVAILWNMNFLYYQLLYIQVDVVTERGLQPSRRRR